MVQRIPLPRFDGCFVCGRPSVNANSLQLQSYLEDGVVKAEFTPSEAQVGYPGIVHGGILTSLLDEISIWAASYRAQSFCVTRDMRTKYAAPAQPGERLLLSAKVIDDRHLIQVEAEIATADGVTIAKSRGRFHPSFPEQWAEQVVPHLGG